MMKAALVASVLVVTFVAPAFAQGNSGNAPGHGTSPGNSGNAPGHSGSQGNSSAPPSRNVLAPVAAADVPVATSATPIAWIDDATLLDAGMVALSLSAVRWDGAGVSEVDVPIVNAAMG